MLDAGCSMLDTGCWILVGAKRKSRALDPDECRDEVGNTGCWILDTGCWMLDTGRVRRDRPTSSIQVTVQVRRL
ncbi:MAG: hypothetical protein D6681_17145 [Calditrichaeota bacterium]|nr:MAG: hypothetical protein D6681_17145 [Calditrichota bacterium]